LASLLLDLILLLWMLWRGHWMQDFTFA